MVHGNLHLKVKFCIYTNKLALLNKLTPLPSKYCGDSPGVVVMLFIYDNLTEKCPSKRRIFLKFLI